MKRTGVRDLLLMADTIFSGAFSPEQKAVMEDVNNEFHLEKSVEGQLALSRIYAFRVTHENKVRQPGEPVTSSIAFENYGKEQIMNFIMTAKKGDIINPAIEIDGSKHLAIPIKLNEGEHMKFDGEYANVYSSNWQIQKSISLEKSLLNITPGHHSLELSSEFSGEGGALGLEIRLKGETETLN